MAEYPLFAAQVGIANGAGAATLQIGPSAVRERWTVTSTTVTALNATVSVSQFGRVVDSTANDPRPTVTTDTVYDVGPGTYLTVTWTGLTAGTAVQVTVSGTRKVGYDDAVH